MPRIIIESHIPFVGPELGQVAEVIRLDPELITPQAVSDVDALIVRTRTRCDASLLANSKVRFVATATIGTDHIDLDYCRANGIHVVSAPGCNAPAVAQYVWASVLSLIPDVSGLTIGIVGLGHVGSIVAQWAAALGVRVLACDPPRSRVSAGWDAAAPRLSGNQPFVSLDVIAREADIITLHTPHTTHGPDATHHLANDVFFSSLRRKPMIINAARGPIVDTEALLHALDSRLVSHAVVDCWEGEPNIDPRLLAAASIATPHIAGYSIEGKQRATAVTTVAALHFLRSTPSPTNLATSSETIQVTSNNNTPESVLATSSETIQVTSNNITPESVLATSSEAVQVTSNNITSKSVLATSLNITPESILASYNPLADTVLLKSPLSTLSPSTPLAARFEHLRNTYPLRHEL